MLLHYYFRSMIEKKLLHDFSTQNQQLISPGDINTQICSTEAIKIKANTICHNYSKTLATCAI